MDQKDGVNLNEKGQIFGDLGGFQPEADFPKSPPNPTTVHTKIRISADEIPSKIDVRVSPLKNQPMKRNSLLNYNIILIIVVVLFIFKSFELERTKQQLDGLRTMSSLFEKRLEICMAQIEVVLRETVLTQNALKNCEKYAKNIQPQDNYQNQRTKRDLNSDNSTNGYPLLASFIGGFQESVINERVESDGNIDYSGVVAPWFKDTYSSREFSLGNVLLKDGKGSAVIPESGLYFLYAQQVYYSSSGQSNSFSIMLVDDENKETKVATCSNPQGGAGESNCFTGTAYYIRKGMKVLLRQKEQNRHILFRRGQTFLGIILLKPSSNEP